MIAPAIRLPPTMILPMAESRYHSLSQISRSQFVDFLESPRLYHKRHVLKEPSRQVKTSAAMDFGTACHRAILEDRDATKAFQIIPDDVLTTDGKKFGNKYKAWEAEHPGVYHLKAKEAEDWLEMWDSIQACQPARELLLDEHAGSLEEQTVLWEHNGIGLRCRLDRVIPNRCIVDLKTCASADLNAIEREIESRKLFIQAAWYTWGWQQASNEQLSFVFVFVEKSEPFRTVCVSIDPDWQSVGMAKIIGGLKRMQACFDAEDFSDPVSSVVHTLARPTYANFKYELVEA